MHGWSSIWTRRKIDYPQFAHKLFWNVYIWHVLIDLMFLSSVNKLARAVTKWTKACDKRLARLISHIHHTCETQTKLLCGKHSTTLQMRIVSRLWFRRRPWRLEVNIRRNSLHFRKSHVRINKLDVQETDFSFTQFHGHGSWNYFSRCRFTHGWDSRSRSLGFSGWSVSFFTKPNQQNQRCKRATGNLSATPQSQKRNRFQLRTPISIWPILITFHQAEHILVPMLCCMSLRIMKPWLRW